MRSDSEPNAHGSDSDAFAVDHLRYRARRMSLRARLEADFDSGMSSRPTRLILNPSPRSAEIEA